MEPVNPSHGSDTGSNDRGEASPSSFGPISIDSIGIVGFGVVEDGGRLIEANAALLASLGVTRDAVRDGSVEWPAPAGHGHPVTASSIASGEPCELELTRPDGSRITVLVSYARVPGSTDRLFVTVVDLTKQKSAEQTLQQSEERLRLLVEEARDYAIFLLDTKGCVMTWNAGAEHIKGYAADEIIGEHFSRFYPPEDIEDDLPRRELDKATESGQFDAEGWRVRKDGRRFWASVTITALRDDDRILRGYSKITRDVGERQKSERLLRSVVDNTLDGIISIDQRGTVQSFNLAAERIFGYSASEVVGQNVRMLMPDPYHREHDGYLSNYLTTGAAKIIGIGREVVGQRKDGATFPMDLAVSEFHLDTGRYFTGIVRDITARKRAEQELREAEEQMRSVVDHVIDGIITIDEIGQVTTFNPGAERVFGYSASEVIGQNVRMLMPEPYHGEHDGYLQNYRSTGNAKIIGIGREVVGRRKGGSTFPMDLAVSAFRLGENRYFTGIVRDISERKRSEERLRETAEELARSNLDLEQFAYVASHDLQEPLRAVSGCVQILQRRYSNQLGDHADELITHTIDGVTRMQQLIDDLLEYSRVGTRGRAFELIALEPVLDRAVANLRVAIAESGAIVTHDPLPDVRADGAQVLQVLQNLLANAVKFRGVDPPRIHVGARKTPGEYVFSVHDNGIGVDPEYFDRIFVIFQRLHTRSEYPGTGIGLAVCKKIIERHGGRIWVESAKGEGTTVLFTIPTIGEEADDYRH